MSLQFSCKGCHQIKSGNGLFDYTLALTQKGDGHQKTKLKDEKEQESLGATEENGEHKKSDQSQDEEKQKDSSSATEETKDNSENIKDMQCNKKFYVP